ncbi:hypothetical protein [Alienimonas californiensis]|nr:hypothetical protein [Alienimonas californiensis]
MPPLRAAAWSLCLLIASGIVVCVALAFVRSTALTAVTVTALDAAQEPRDHALPLVRQTEALPDYEIVLRGRRLFEHRSLGVKPDRSAVDGLRWEAAPPVALAEVVAVDLRERDAILSDTLATAQPTVAAVQDGNYRFEFETGRSWEAGVESFFDTPIGKALTAGIMLAIVALVLLPFLGPL